VTLFNVFILILTSIAINSAQAETEDSIDNPYGRMTEYYVCRRKNDKRPIWIEKQEPTGCKLWYSHYKNKGPAAVSDKDLNYCELVSEKIRKNLTAAQFECKPKTLLNK
jgi:hypothetical protein